VLLDREATDFACLPSVTIEDVGAGPTDPEELMLDHQRGIAGPAGDPDEILVGRHGIPHYHIVLWHVSKAQESLVAK
jgi:hypothetical protein